MPAPKRRYYSTKDIQTILGIGKTKANELMHMFDSWGAVLKIGRSLRVEINTFEDWLNNQGGINNAKDSYSIGHQGFRGL